MIKKADEFEANTENSHVHEDLILVEVAFHKRVVFQLYKVNSVDQTSKWSSKLMNQRVSSLENKRSFLTKFIWWLDCGIFDEMT